MSVSNRMFWALRNNDFLLEFVAWLSREYPITFKSLAEQFFKHKEIQT